MNTQWTITTNIHHSICRIVVSCLECFPVLLLDTVFIHILLGQA